MGDHEHVWTGEPSVFECAECGERTPEPPPEYASHRAALARLRERVAELEQKAQGYLNGQLQLQEAHLALHAAIDERVKERDAERAAREEAERRAEEWRKTAHALHVGMDQARAAQDAVEAALSDARAREERIRGALRGLYSASSGARGPFYQASHRENAAEALDAALGVARTMLAAAPPAAATETGEGPRCAECDGRGWIEEVEAAHDPGCDGSCRNCPVPVQVQVACAVCSGTGRASRGESAAPPRDYAPCHGCRKYQGRHATACDARIVRVRPGEECEHRIAILAHPADCSCHAAPVESAETPDGGRDG